MKTSNIIALASVFGFATTLLAVERSPLVDAAKLDGTKIFDTHGNQLGNLQRVLVEPQTGIARYGVIEVDKAWNWNDPEVAVPWSAFTVNGAGQKDLSLTLDASKQKLEQAPRFKQGDADRIYKPDTAQPIYSYWSAYWWEMPAHPQTSGTGTTGNSPATPNPNAADSSSPGKTPSSEPAPRK